MSKFKRFIIRNLINLKYAFRIKKPLLIVRLIKTYLKILFLRSTPLRYVDFAIDYTCNLKCEHCFATVLIKENTPRMSLEDYRRVAQDCLKMGAVHFSFQGGEPLLFKELDDVIKCFKPYKSLISVTTNGTLLNKERILQLKKIGVDILTVSVDSGIPEEHDRFRGVIGSYDKTLNGIRIALENDLRVTIGTTVSHQTLHSQGFIRLIENAQKMKVNVVLALAVPAGRWMQHKDILLTEEDMDYIRSLTKKYAYLRTDFEANYLKSGCGAMKEILYLTPYGDVLSCPFIHISFGNIFQESIIKIRERGLKNKFFKCYHDKCLAAQDKFFMSNFLPQALGKESLPIQEEKVFPRSLYY